MYYSSLVHEDIFQVLLPPQCTCNMTTKSIHCFRAHVKMYHMPCSNDFILIKFIHYSNIDPNSVLGILNYYVHTLKHKWFHLGLSLGLHYSTLKCIEASHHLGIDNHITNVLHKWLNEVDCVSERGPPCWRSLALALDCPLVCECQVARSIRDEHQISLNPVEELQ